MFLSRLRDSYLFLARAAQVVLYFWIMIFVGDHNTLIGGSC